MSTQQDLSLSKISVLYLVPVERYKIDKTTKNAFLPMLADIYRPSVVHPFELIFLFGTTAVLDLLTVKFEMKRMFPYRDITLGRIVRLVDIFQRGSQ